MYVCVGEQTYAVGSVVFNHGTQEFEQIVDMTEKRVGREQLMNDPNYAVVKKQIIRCFPHLTEPEFKSDPESSYWGSLHDCTDITVTA